MKKITLFISISLFCICLSSCGSVDHTDPAKVAEAFAKAYFVADYDACNELMTDNAQGSFTPSKEMSETEKSFIEIMEKNGKKHQYQIAYDKENSSIEDTNARIVLIVTAKGNSDFKNEGNITLIKDESGKWRVKRYTLREDKSAYK